MSRPELLVLARAAGRRGVSWRDWPSELSEELLDELCRGKTDDLQATHLEGWCAHLVADRGWISLWTTAPKDYDGFGTTTTEGSFEWGKQQLRRVIADPDHARWQTYRYGSGLHGTWDEDPRIEEAREQERIVRARIERFLLGVRVAAGATWLASLSDEELDNFDEDERGELLRGFGLSWDQHQHERRKREAAVEHRVRAEEWARCRALVPDGTTLIDEGTPGVQGHYGWIPGRPKDAWRSVTVRVDWRGQNVETAEVHGEGRFAGSLTYVAEQIEKGTMRLARPDECVPPRKVVERIGCSYTEIVRYEEGGRVAWAGRPLFGSEPLVLDDDGKVVRAKRLAEAARKMWWDWYLR